MQNSLEKHVVIFLYIRIKNYRKMYTPYYSVDQMEKVERLVRNAVKQTDLYHLIQVNYQDYLFTIDLSDIVFCVL